MVWSILDQFRIVSAPNTIYKHAVNLTKYFLIFVGLMMVRILSFHFTFVYFFSNPLSFLTLFNECIFEHLPTMSRLDPRLLRKHFLVNPIARSFRSTGVTFQLTTLVSVGIVSDRGYEHRVCVFSPPRPAVSIHLARPFRSCVVIIH